MSGHAQTITLGGGCFWCTEAVFKEVRGIVDVESGYANGRIAQPSYEEVCTGQTGCNEVVQLRFDPALITVQEVLEIFFLIHDPTTLNRQGNDIGRQYRSAIFYHSEAQQKIAEASKAAAAKNFKDPIVTEITKSAEFYRAPDGHQDYYFQNKSKNPYCRFVIEPKLKKLKLDH